MHILAVVIFKRDELAYAAFPVYIIEFFGGLDADHDIHTNNRLLSIDDIIFDIIHCLIKPRNASYSREHT